MPTLEHEVIVDIAKQHPETLRELLRPLLGTEWGDATWREDAPVVVSDVDFSQLVPTQYLADAVLCIGDPVEFALVVEVQRAIDVKKLRSWPLYVHALFAELGCPVELVVIATRDVVASWAGNRVRTTLRSHFEPSVIGPSQVPSRFDTDGAGPPSPELLVLAAAMHGHGPSAEHIGRSAMEYLYDPGASSSLADREANLYLDFVLASLPEVVRHALELEMNVQNYEFQTDFAKKYHGQGLQEGREEGREEGIEVGLRRALYALLTSRQWVVDDALRLKIETCSDPAVLEGWVTRAASATSLDGVFE